MDCAAVFALIAVMVIMGVFAKPTLAVISILLGDKKGIAEFGNLCEDPNKPLVKRLAEWHEEDEWRRQGGGQ